MPLSTDLLTVVQAICLLTVVQATVRLMEVSVTLPCYMPGNDQIASVFAHVRHSYPRKAGNKIVT